ncbi:hypothetical protein Ddye_000938 [Dipteronia dyeriana]|uniref:Transmembrane protein n=1 Tax=Dipteronia dyeriana TaxID=168575 RepID=A0AAE0CT28_9ROSI|nr:hypothetical protein Ddye_000938 [Dipteronia dyeriana]
MADWGPVVIAVMLFVLLTPGLLFQLPGGGRIVEFGNMQTSGASILVHTIIFFGLLTVFLIAVNVNGHEILTSELYHCSVWYIGMVFPNPKSSGGRISICGLCLKSDNQSDNVSASKFVQGSSNRVATTGTSLWIFDISFSIEIVGTPPSCIAVL